MPTLTRSARSTWLSFAVTAIALTGCSSSGTPPAADTGSPAASYLRTSPWGEGDTALLEGTLSLTNGCLTVVDDAGQVVVPVFPTDFAWGADAGELAGFGHTFSVGGVVSVGGGFSDTPPSIVEHLPSGCAGDQYFVVHSA